MNKIGLFHLLFALGSVHSLSSTQSDNNIEDEGLAEYVSFEPLGILSWIFEYNNYLNNRRISLIHTKMGKKSKCFFVECVNFNSSPKIQDLKEVFEKKWGGNLLIWALYRGLGGQLQIGGQKDHILGFIETDEDNSPLKNMFQIAIEEGKGYTFAKNEKGKIDVKTFSLWKANYRGRFTLLGIVVALVLVSASFLGFFLSKDGRKYIEHK